MYVVVIVMKILVVQVEQLGIYLDMQICFRFQIFIDMYVLVEVRLFILDFEKLFLGEKNEVLIVLYE